MRVRTSWNKKHGLSDTPFYNVWYGMKRRCDTPNHISYKNYGGRGIRVCDEWLIFDNFQKDMYSLYTNHERKNPKNTSIDRIDKNGNYCKENCKWIKKTEQQKNRRGNIYITYQRKTMTLAEWARKLGVPKMRLYQRYVQLNWSFEDAVKTPSRLERYYSNKQKLCVN